MVGSGLRGPLGSEEGVSVSTQGHAPSPSSDRADVRDGARLCGSPTPVFRGAQPGARGAQAPAVGPLKVRAGAPQSQIRGPHGVTLGHSGPQEVVLGLSPFPACRPHPSSRRCSPWKPPFIKSLALLPEKPSQSTAEINAPGTITSVSLAAGPGAMLGGTPAAPPDPRHPSCGLRPGPPTPSAHPPRPGLTPAAAPAPDSACGVSHAGRPLAVPGQAPRSLCCCPGEIFFILFNKYVLLSWDRVFFYVRKEQRNCSASSPGVSAMSN